jgi:hypothetical protein
VDVRAAVSVLMAMTAVILTACTPPVRAVDGAGALVYVADADAGTIVRLSAVNGRQVGPPVPVGRWPRAVVPGAAGSMLVSSVPLVPRVGEALFWVGPPTSGSKERVVPLAESVAQVLVTGPPHVGADAVSPGSPGDAYAVATYVTQSGDPDARCRLVVVDLRSGAIRRSQSVCAAGQRVVALSTGMRLPAGRETTPVPIAYLGIWSDSEGAARLEAIDLESGALLARAPLTGSPAWVLPGCGGTALLCVGLFHRDPPADPFIREEGVTFSVLVAESTSLQAIREVPEPVVLFRITTPDGAVGYALDPFGRQLLRVDLATGMVAQFGALDPPGVDVVASSTSVFVAVPRAGRVLVIDRATGRITRSQPAGQRPMGLALH